MTLTEWKRKRRTLLAGKPVEWTDKDGKHEIRIFNKGFGKEYSLISSNGNVVECTWNLDNIGALLVD